jgi:hypothetical protein
LRERRKRIKTHTSNNDDSTIINHEQYRIFLFVQRRRGSRCGCMSQEWRCAGTEEAG